MLRIPNQAHLKLTESKAIMLRVTGNHLQLLVVPRWNISSTSGTMLMMILSMISPTSSVWCQRPTLRIESGGPG